MAAPTPAQLQAAINRNLPRFKPGNPVTLTGSVALNPGESKLVNIDALRNPSNLPLAIHELKFVATTGVAVTPVSFFSGTLLNTTPPATSGALEVSIKVGAHKITRGPIPVNLLGVRRSALVEALGATGLATVAQANAEFTFGLSQQVWRLDAPIILQGGQVLDVMAGHRNFFPYPITAYVAMSGQYLSTLPKRVELPYVAAFVPPAFVLQPATLDSLIRVSTERDLVNELEVPLKVRRLTGRATVPSNVATGALLDVIPSYGSLLLTVQMKSASGTPTVRDDTPFENVFDAVTAAWECPHTLPPRSYWTTTLKCAMPDTPLTVVHAGIALHGTREVKP